jgi:hypothetical protein
MATVNSVTPSLTAENSGQPSARLGVARVNVTGAAAYVEGGDSLAASLPGAKVIACPFVPTYDTSELRWARVEDSDGTPMLKFYDNDNGAPGTETDADDDVSGHTLDLDVTFV